MMHLHLLYGSINGVRFGSLVWLKSAERDCRVRLADKQQSRICKKL